MLETKKAIVFFDTETTGILKDEAGKVISNGSMIQLAYRKLENWIKTDENLFFDTETKIEVGSMAVHWIYKKLLLEKSKWKFLEDDVREKLSKIFTENISIAHNLDFDKDVLEKSNIEIPKEQIDTLKVAKILWSEWVLQNSKWENPEYVNLQYLRYFFELYEITDEEGKKECTTAHDAFWDVVVLEKVFYNLFEIIKNKLEKNDDEILEIMKEMSAKEFILIKTMRIWKYRWKTFEEVAQIDSWYLNWMIKADFSEDIKYSCKVALGLIKDKKFFV